MIVWVEKARRLPRKRRVEAVGERMSRAVKTGLISGIDTFKQRVDNHQLYNSWLSGDWRAVDDHIPWHEMPADMDDLYVAMAGGVAGGAREAIELLPPDARDDLRFDLNNTGLQHWIARTTGSRITDVTNDSRQAVRLAVEDSFRTAQTPRQISRRIKGAIGLLPSQQTALMRYRSGLAAGGMGPGRVEQLEDRYRERLLDYRAQMIARTETQGAINRGQLEVWKGAQNQGLISKQSQKVWQVDGAPCDVCSEMDGQAVGLNEQFESPEGEAVDHPPLHPHCLCTITIEEMGT